MLKTEEKIYDDLVNIFDCKIIGSYKLYKEELLDLEDIGDIDIYIYDDKVQKNIIRYLNSNGYIQKTETKCIDSYNRVFRKYSYSFFQKKDYFDIHLIPFEKGYKFSKEEILSQKIKRFDTRDKEHLNKIIERMKPNEIKNEEPQIEEEYCAK